MIEQFQFPLDKSNSDGSGNWGWLLFITAAVIVTAVIVSSNKKSNTENSGNAQG